MAAHHALPSLGFSRQEHWSGLPFPSPRHGSEKWKKPGFYNTWTVNFQMFKMGLEKAEEPEIKLPTSAGSFKKQEISRKTSTFALLTMQKPLTVWITTNWKILQEMVIPDHLTCLFWNLYAGQELDMEQQTGSKLGKEYVKAVYCHSVYLTYIQSTSWETLDWKKHNLESVARRNLNNLRYADDTTLMAEIE